MQSTFFKEFLMISDIKTIIFIFVLMGIFLGFSRLSKKKVQFSTRMILSTIAGLLLGFFIQLVAKFPNNPMEVTWITETSKWYGLIGNGFLDLLKMLVVPIVLISIIRVISNMEKDENIGKLTGLSIGSLLSITLVSAIIGIIVANVMKLGVGANVIMPTGENTIKEIQPIADTLRGLLPSNIVNSMATGNIIAVVIFAVFIGISIRRLKIKKMDKIKVFIDFIEASYTIMTSVAMNVIKMMPYAVVALMANVLASRGLGSLKEVIGFIIAIYVAATIAFIFQLIIVSCCKLNPFKYVKNVLEALVLAFTSRSSLGTLPVTIKVLSENVGIKEGTATFVGSLGSNMGMNGCAGIYPSIMAVTLANMVGMQLDVSFYATLLIIIVISSLGIAGLPGTAIMAVSVVLSGVGLGEYFPLAAGIIAIDPILDMARTMINVNGTMISAVTTSSALGHLDKEKYNS